MIFEINIHSIQNINLFCLYVVLGDSAGGHLVTSLVFRWRRMVLNGAPPERAGLHPIKLQVPKYPVTQFMNLSTASFLLNRHDYLLPKSDQARNRARVLLGEAKTNDPECSMRSTRPT